MNARPTPHARRPAPRPPRLATLAVALFAAAMHAAATPPSRTAGALPDRLHDTGLYARPPSGGTDAGPAETLGPGVRPFEPRYALWSDGADKRRWVRIPPGRSIDKRQPDAWQFPPGTQFWKEFSRGGRRIETRYIVRGADGGWRFASYRWDEAGREARRVPAEGLRALAVPQALDGRWDIPSRDDCLACHGGAPVPVLGYSAVQSMAPDAGHPRPATRAALGYLHANCGHCHHGGPNAVPVPLTLALRAADGALGGDVLQGLTAPPLRYRAATQAADAQLVRPGRPEASVLRARMHTRSPLARMPPLGTRLPDSEGLALIDRWIANDFPTAPQPTQLETRNEFR